MVVQFFTRVWCRTVRFAEALERRPEDDLRDELDRLRSRLDRLERAAGPGFSA